MEELIGEKSFGILQFCFPPKHSPALSCFRTTTAMYLSLNSKCICVILLCGYVEFYNYILLCPWLQLKAFEFDLHISSLNFSVSTKIDHMIIVHFTWHMEITLMYQIVTYQQFCLNCVSNISHTKMYCLMNGVNQHSKWSLYN